MERAYYFFGAQTIDTLADQITAALQVVVGQSLADCWRATTMAVFDFGPTHRVVNHKGVEVDRHAFSLHLQCYWRVVDARRILFGIDDLWRPADPSISVDDFDWDEHESRLDRLWRTWLAEQAGNEPKVIACTGDIYGGFQIELERGFALEVNPCSAGDEQRSEHWRLLGPGRDARHFVVTNHGVEGSE